MKKKMIFILFIVIIFSLIYTNTVLALTEEQSERIMIKEFKTDDKIFARKLGDISANELGQAIEDLENEIRALNQKINNAPTTGDEAVKWHNEKESEIRTLLQIYESRLEVFKDVDKNEGYAVKRLINENILTITSIENYMKTYYGKDTELYEILKEELKAKYRDECSNMTLEQLKTTQESVIGYNGAALQYSTGVTKDIISIKNDVLTGLISTAKVVDTNKWKPTLLSDDSKFKEKAGIILGAINAIGIAVSVITIAILGIKYMLAPVTEKAEYKQTAIGWIIGAILVFSATTIPNIIYNIMK